MQANEYQKKALRTARGLDDNSLIINGVMGLSGETGEVMDIVKKWMFQGHDLDYEKAKEELGDLCWYIAITAEGLHLDLESVMEGNVEKLKKRYPDGFDSKRSRERAI